MLSIGVSLTRIVWFFSRGGGFPLTPPRNLTWVERTAGVQNYVHFSWQAPLSWGPGPHATAPYQYQFREEGHDGSLNNWNITPLSYAHSEFNQIWIPNPPHPPNRMQFRVRSQDSAGETSSWVESAVLTQGEVNPRHGRFARRFGGRFD